MIVDGRFSPKCVEIKSKSISKLAHPITDVSLPKQYETRLGATMPLPVEDS